MAIRDLHERYGHIQEVIVQNFRAKPDYSDGECAGTRSRGDAAHVGGSSFANA